MTFTDERRDIVVQLEDLRYDYATHQAVRGVDLVMNRGEVFALPAPTAPARRPRWRSSRAIDDPRAATFGCSGSIHSETVGGCPRAPA